MKSHFWHSAGAITVTLEQIGAMTDVEARYLLAELRWGSSEQQVCPECGTIDRHYDVRVRNQWRCKSCGRTFSVTSDSPFADHKLSYRRLALAIFSFITHQKGLPALELRRIIGGHYRTCFLLLHKIREAILGTGDETKLSGVIEIDGAHFSGRKRKGRKQKKRAAKAVPKKYANQQHRARVPRTANSYHPNRRIVMSLREVSEEKTDAIDSRTKRPIGKGARRTLVAVCMSENAKDIEALVRRHVAPGSTIRTDELPAYRKLKLMGYQHDVVNHSVEFVTDEGINQNQAESFFGRMRRAKIGLYHRIAPKYMLDYASEMAWREDVRRLDTMSQLKALASRIFKAGVSVDWINYCRGNMRKVELLFQAAAPAPA